MIPAANGPLPARKASAGVGTTPTVDVDAEARRAAAIAATNMSPERRVSWPTTSDPPATDEAVRGRPPEGVGEGRLEVDVGDAADPVRAEQSGHRQGSGLGMGGVGTATRRRDGDGDVTGRTGRDERDPGGRSAVTGTSVGAGG